MLKKIFKDFGIYGLMPFLPKFAGLLALPIITPYLTVKDFGVFGIIMAYTGFFNIFYNLGLNLNFSNSYFKSRNQFKWLWRQLYGFWTLWSVIYALLLSVVLWVIMPLEAKDNAVLIITLSIIPIVLFGPTAEIATLLYRFRRRPIPVALRSAVVGLINVFITVYTIKYLQLGYMGWFWAASISTLILNISWWYPLNFIDKISPIFNFKKRTIIQALKVSLPIIPHSNAFYLLNQSDRIVMDALKVSTENIGIYNAAYTTTTLIQQIGDIYIKTLTPYILDLINKKKEYVLRSIFFMFQALFFMIGLGFACIAEEFFQFMLRSDGFEEAYKLGVLIVLSSLFKPMYQAANIRLFYHEKTKSISIHSLFAGILNLTLNFLLIPIFGFEIAAVTTIIGFLFVAYSRFYSKDYKDNAVLDYKPLTWLILSISMCLISYAILFFDIKIRLFLFVIFTCIGLLIIMKYNKIIKE